MEEAGYHKSEYTFVTNYAINNTHWFKQILDLAKNVKLSVESKLLSKIFSIKIYIVFASGSKTKILLSICFVP